MHVINVYLELFVLIVQLTLGFGFLFKEGRKSCRVLARPTPLPRCPLQCEWPVCDAVYTVARFG